MKKEVTTVEYLWEAAEKGEKTKNDPYSAEFGLAYFSPDKKQFGRGLAALITGKKKK